MAETVTETQAADVLTKGPAPFSLGAPESPSPEKAEPTPSLPETLAGRFDFYKQELQKIIGDLGAKTAVSDAQTAEAEKQYGRTVETVVKPAMARVKAQTEVPPPAIPKQLPVPPQPDISARPFGATEKNTLGSVVQTLGLMAQMAMGAGKAPKAALGAFTGAMNGWAEGDSIRAERDWKKYLEQVDTIRQENRQALGFWEAASRQHGQNEQAATAALSVALAEAGFAKDAITVAEKGRTRALQDFNTQAKMIDQLFGTSLELEKIRVQSEANREMRAYRAQHDKDVAEATERRHRENLEERQRASNQAHADRIQAFKARHAETSTEGQFTPESLEFMAQQYYATGNLPPMGMGKASTEARTKILNRAAELANSAGTSGADQVARTQFARATQNELSALMRQRGAVMAFASTADQNLEAALALSKKVDRTGVPVINRWILAGRKEIEGDPDVTQFNIYNNRAVTEIARLTSSAGGSGQATDTARREAEELLKTAFNETQYEAAVGALKQEVTFRRKGYEDQIKATQDAVRKLAPGGQAAPASSAVPPAPKPGMVRVKRKSDGQTGWLEKKDLGDLYEVIQ